MKRRKLNIDYIEGSYLAIYIVHQAASGAEEAPHQACQLLRSQSLVVCIGLNVG